MTASEAIATAKETRQGAIDYSQYLKWINVLEGRVQVELMGKHPNEIIKYTQEDDNKELLVPHPYDEIYVYYLCAMTDFFNEEWDIYANDADVFEKKFEDYKTAYGKFSDTTTYRIHNYMNA